MTQAIWSEEFEIRSYLTDFRGNASIQTLCRFFQETAGNHARNMGFALDQLQAEGKTWVLSRFHIQVQRYPRWREHVRIETWPSGSIGFYAVRDFYLYNQQNQRLASASSIWLILDLNRKTPLRIPQALVDMNVTDRDRAIADRFDTLWRPEQGSALTRMFEKSFVARKSDVDLNRHVNNVSYVEWAVETVPDDVWRTHLLTEIEVSFRAETLYGDAILSQSDQVKEARQQVFRHRIVRESDQTEMFLARTRWNRIEDEQG